VSRDLSRTAGSIERTRLGMAPKRCSRRRPVVRSGSRVPAPVVTATLRRPRLTGT